MLNGARAFKAAARSTGSGSFSGRFCAVAGTVYSDTCARAATTSPPELHPGVRLRVAEERRMPDAHRIKLEPDPYDQFNIALGYRVGDLVIVSGQAALDDRGRVVGQGDFDAQAEQVFANLRRVLEAAGSSRQRRHRSARRRHVGRGLGTRSSARHPGGSTASRCSHAFRRALGLRPGQGHRHGVSAIRHCRFPAP